MTNEVIEKFISHVRLLCHEVRMNQPDVDDPSKRGRAIEEKVNSDRVRTLNLHIQDIEDESYKLEQLFKGNA